MSDSLKRFNVRLTMFSDWHIGTGAGRPGSIDKLMARDTDGFPFVPAKTLNGIWRDALEILTWGLDNGKEDDWSKYVDLIFGNQPALPKADPTITPFSSILNIQPARLSEDLRKKINSFDEPNRQKYLSALTFVKPGVAIDEDSGTAKPDFLRFEEMGRSDTVLEACCELSYCDETIWGLMVASAKLVERIGGKRRRGAGKCMLEVVNAKGDEIHYLESFKDKDAPKAPELKKQSYEDAFDLKRGTTIDKWQRLDFSLTLKTPISIVTATLGNVSESLDFIPGTYLLPYFTKKLGRKIFNAVAYGDFQVLPTTIEINDERGLPVPKVLAVEKVEGSFKKSNTYFNKIHDKNPEGVQLKNLREGYISNFDSLDGQMPAYKRTPKTLLMHNVVKDDVQRPSEDVVGVFSREAIAAGIKMRGEIRLKKSIAETLGEKWHEKLSGNVRLGTSRKDDYGLTELEILNEPGDISSQTLLNPNAPNELTVYLLSDVLLRDASLRQSNLVEDLAEAICQKMNEGVTDTNEKVCLTKKDSITQVRRIESWHQEWGFPRPTLIAMAAGSCVVFEDTNRKLDLEKLKQIEIEGIGERRGEGYGQVRFNPPLLTRAINGWLPDNIDKKDEPLDDLPDSLVAHDFIKQIEETVWREELQIAVLKVAADSNKRIYIFGLDIEGKMPPMSQLSGLRSVISRLYKDEDKSLVLSWLNNLKKTKNRRDRWADNESNATQKIDHIIDLIEDQKEERNIWKLLGTSWKEPKKLTNRDLKKLFWAEAVRSLFDACARAHKRDLEKKEKG
jgi:CRISPR-associated protein Csx10